MAEGCYRGPEFCINCTSTTPADINVNVDEPSIRPIPLVRAKDSLVRVTNISLDAYIDGYRRCPNLHGGPDKEIILASYAVSVAWCSVDDTDATTPPDRPRTH
ncbi:hypothetical protein D8674_002575 [Pyrus ussuriensis x Pyrus communis]|uniref:Uncharacterized protein n=1 Tax=Pyrus ussuriensis x Pyrus communis TaxID=2448454 RepID=A0A5N5FK07_9ROSA|nr:hypothetical protein D8674_002575 [Pyrus ussuriensis x Pyrus communis]